METFYYRGRKCKYSGDVIPVFGIGHHKPETEGEDDFTKKVINFYKYGNEQERSYLMQKFTELFENKFRDSIQFDYLCVVPRHEKESINPYMQAFAKEFGEKIEVHYKQVIRRNKTIKGQHELVGSGSSEERFENVKNSIEVIDDVKEKGILVLDNLCITGANAQEVFYSLKKAGAKTIYFLCFGLGSKGKERDFDINPNFKANSSEIVEKLHWPKASKEERKAYAESKKKNL